MTITNLDRLNIYCEAIDLVEYSDLSLDEFSALCHLAVLTVPCLNAIPFPDGKAPSDALRSLRRKGYADYGDIVSLTHKGAVLLGIRGLPHPVVGWRKSPLDALFSDDGIVRSGYSRKERTR